MANSEDSTKSIFDRTGVVCDWFGKEIGVSYRLTSVPDGFTDNISDADQSILEDGRFTGTMTIVSAMHRLLLCPVVLSLQSGRNLEITVNHMNGLTDEYGFITTALDRSDRVHKAQQIGAVDIQSLSLSHPQHRLPRRPARAAEASRPQWLRAGLRAFSVIRLDSRNSRDGASTADSQWQSVSHTSLAA